MNGCWQKDSLEARSSLPDRFNFYAIDKPFTFKGNPVEKIEQRKLDFSGKFHFPSKNQIELEIITKDIINKNLEKPRIYPISGKNYRPMIVLKTKPKALLYDYKAYF